MNKILFLFITAGLIFLLSCEKNETKSDSPTFNFFDGTIGNSNQSTISSLDDNLITCGNWEGYISIIKSSKSGNKIWRKDFNEGIRSEAFSLTQVSNGDLFICGKTSRNSSESKDDVLLIKMKSDGDMIWSKTYGGTDSDWGTNIISTSDGNILIAGFTVSFGATNYGLTYLLKINLNGDTIWTKRYSNNGLQIAHGLIETLDKGYLVTVTTEIGDEPCGFFLLKTDSEGKELWRKAYPEYFIFGNSSIELSNGDLVTCGGHFVGFPGLWPFKIRGINKTLNFKQLKTYEKDTFY